MAEARAAAVAEVFLAAAIVIFQGAAGRLWRFQVLLEIHWRAATRHRAATYVWNFAGLSVLPVPFQV